MSYSFSVRADSKAEACSKIEAELANIVNAQPSHVADKQAAQDAAAAFVAVLRDPAEGEQISVTMYGSLSWRQTDAYEDASISVSASVVAKSQT